LQRKTYEGQALRDCCGTTKLITVSAEGFFIHTRHVHILAAGASADVGIDVIIIIIAIKWHHVLEVRWWWLRCRCLVYLAFG
jgi:hypothetical protein